MDWAGTVGMAITCGGQGAGTGKAAGWWAYSPSQLVLLLSLPSPFSHWVQAVTDWDRPQGVRMAVVSQTDKVLDGSSGIRPHPNPIIMTFWTDRNRQASASY